MGSVKAFRNYLIGSPSDGTLGRLDEIGMSVEQFAKACGLTRTAVYWYLEGKHCPTELTLHAMAKVLGDTWEHIARIAPSRGAGRSPSRSTVGQVVSSQEPEVRAHCSNQLGKGNGIPYPREGQFEFEPHFYLARELKRMMSKHEPALSVRELSIISGITMESIRRIVSDRKTTSEQTIRDVADALRLSQEDTRGLLWCNTLDCFEREFGGKIDLANTTIPVEISQRWELLSDTQKSEIAALISRYASENSADLPQTSFRRPSYSRNR